MTEERKTHSTWTRAEIESARLHWRYVSQTEESEMFSAQTIAMADGYASALEMVLRNTPPEGETSEHLLLGWFGVHYGRPPSTDETMLLHRLAADFHLVRKQFLA